MTPHSSRIPTSTSNGFVHPLQSLLDKMGRDPAFAEERRRIEEYIKRSTVVMSGAEPDREDLAATRWAVLEQEAREEVARYVDNIMSDRDREWIGLTTELLKVLWTRGDEKPELQEHLEDALLAGLYARLAPGAFVRDLAAGRDRGARPDPA